jgi:hypothetical protein
MPESTSSDVGLVLGSQDATPLEFWVGVREGERLQLDDLVVAKTTLSDGDQVTFYGIVDIVRKRFEGSQFDTDAFRVAAGTLPADISYAAHVQVTRVEPELFVPPTPGIRFRLFTAKSSVALCIDRMERSVAIGRREPVRPFTRIWNFSTALAALTPRSVAFPGCHEDIMHKLHPIFPLSLERARPRCRERKSAHLQRQGRRSPVVGQGERQAHAGNAS